MSFLLKKSNKTKPKYNEIEMCNHLTCSIEHFFNLANMCLQENAISQKITKETYAERTKQHMLSFSSEVIDNKIIDSMPKRINIVIAAKGQRIKY